MEVNWKELFPYGKSCSRHLSYIVLLLFSVSSYVPYYIMFVESKSHVLYSFLVFFGPPPQRALYKVGI